MPKIGDAFRALSREEFTPLAQLCPNVRTVPWDKLADGERRIVFTILHFLRQLQRRGLVEGDVSVNDRISTSNILQLKFRRTYITDDEERVRVAVEDTIYALRCRGMGAGVELTI